MTARATLRPMSLALLLVPALPAVAAKNAEEITDHALFADDGETREFEGAVSFAVIGNTREGVPMIDNRVGRRGFTAGVTEALVADMVTQVEAGGPEFLVSLGDTVRTGSVLEYNGWSRRFRKLVEGGPAPVAGAKRLKVVPVAGDHEASGDKRFEAWMGAFPGVGADIGYNRVGSWYAFDVETKGETWRFMVLDTGKKRLGSRWTEQMNWIPRALEGRYDGLLVFMHDGLIDLSGATTRKTDHMNPDNGPFELVDKVEESAPDLTTLRAIFFAGGHANQLMLPDGTFGPAYVGAGGGGAPGEDLKRWAAAEAANRKEDVQLEPRFDLALLGALSDWNGRMNDKVPDIVIDEAKAQNSFEGFIGAYNAGAFPTYGWWQVDLDGEQIALNFRMYMPDGQMKFLYRLTWTGGDGWKAMSF